MEIPESVLIDAGIDRQTAFPACRDLDDELRQQGVLTVWVGVRSGAGGVGRKPACIALPMAVSAWDSTTEATSATSVGISGRRRGSKPVTKCDSSTSGHLQDPIHSWKCSSDQCRSRRSVDRSASRSGSEARGRRRAHRDDSKSACSSMCSLRKICDTCASTVRSVTKSSRAIDLFD